LSQILARTADPTGFTSALEALLEEVPDAVCATFLDSEGETIDLATRIDPYDAMIFSAELALPLASLRVALKQLSAGSSREVCLTGEKKTAIVYTVYEGCNLLLIVVNRASVPRATYACMRAAQRLRLEAGLGTRKMVSSPPEGPSGKLPRAFLEDGQTRRIASIVGTRDATITESLLVRTPEGDECVIARDPNSQRWYRI
jgi:predicted regulator of Ras-like GTPase activity (Roadblock/LC7/MglB family)